MTPYNAINMRDWLREERDKTPQGSLRSAYNDACDRMDVLVSRLTNPGQDAPETNVALMATLPDGVKVVALTVFKEWVILATETGIYRTDGKGPFEPITLKQVEGEQPC